MDEEIKKTKEEKDRVIEMADKLQTHILAFPYPAEGHINPMMNFAKRLVSKGLRVTLIVATSKEKPAQNQDSDLFNIEYISDGSKDGEEPGTIVGYFKRLYAAMSRDLINLITELKASNHPPKLLVYDSTLTWALDLAHQLGLFGASFFTESCSISKIYYHVHQGTLKIPPSEGEKSSVSIPLLPLLEMDDLPSFASVMDPEQTISKFFSGQFSNVEEADWIFFNTFDKLESEVANWMARKWSVKTVGPTLLKDNKHHGTSILEMDSKAVDWLDKRDPKSVVYVSLGSVAIVGEEQMEELANGLLNSDCYFLWMVRASEECKLPANFKSKISEKGLIVNWCPQLEVLEHQAVACFMTHCGWNSTIEALTSGVPMIAMPQMIDQMTNAKFVADVWKAGVRVKANAKGIVTSEEIEMRIREVTQCEKGKEVRKNAKKWKELAEDATAKGGSSDRNIDDFVLEISSV